MEGIASLYQQYLNQLQNPIYSNILYTQPTVSFSSERDGNTGEVGMISNVPDGVYDGSKKALGLTFGISGVPGLVARGIAEGLTNRGVFGNTGIMAQNFLSPSSIYGGYTNPFGGLLGDDGFSSGVTGMNFGSGMDDPSLDAGDSGGNGVGSGADEGGSGADSGSGSHSDPGD
tara:strand:- start:55 stop:573 length:519 start_codon:yes stop_codon:yes gene_type:complete